MKIIKSLPVLLLAFIVLGCSDNNQDNSPVVQKSFKMSPNDIEKTYNDIVALDDTSDQILAVSVLVPEDKLELWIYKLENFKANNSLNGEQLEFINELQVELNQDIFRKGTEARENFLKNRSNVLLNEAKELFGNNEGWYLLTKVENINHRIEKIQNGTSYKGGLHVIKSCDCEEDNECKRINGISVWGLSWENGKCSNSNCYQKEWFFGFIVSDNDGRCAY